MLHQCIKLWSLLTSMIRLEYSFLILGSFLYPWRMLSRSFHKRCFCSCSPLILLCSFIEINRSAFWVLLPVHLCAPLNVSKVSLDGMSPYTMSVMANFAIFLCFPLCLSAEPWVWIKFCPCVVLWRAWAASSGWAVLPWETASNRTLSFSGPHFAWRWHYIDWWMK